MSDKTVYKTRPCYFVWLVLLITVALGCVVGTFVPGMLPNEGGDSSLDPVLYTLIGAGAGLVIGIIICVIAAASCKSADEKAIEDFAPVREKLVTVRRVVCESRAVTDDFYATTFIGDYSYKRGRLYLTYDAVEFYDDQFKVDYKNFLINIHDICFVKARCMFRHKVVLYTRSGKYVIRVPLGTASFWCRQIRHVMQRGSRSVRPTTFVNYY
jgi:hypothetical protein